IEAYKYTDVAVVDVLTDEAVAFTLNAFDASHGDVFTDGCDEGFALIFYASAFEGSCEELFEGLDVVLEGGFGQCVNELDKFLVTGHEVCFAVDFDEHALGFVVGDGS